MMARTFSEIFFGLVGACVVVGTALFAASLIYAQVAAPTPAPAYQSAANATWDTLLNVAVIDGDTINADIYLGRDVLLRDQRIRLEGVDAWETSRRRRSVTVTDDEIEKGQAAAKALSALVRESQVQCLTDGGRDVYGRCLGRLRLIQRDGSVIEAEGWMRANGHDRNEQPPPR